MAEIRMQHKKGGHVWVWIVLAVVVLVAAVFLLDRAGYIELPVRLGTGPDAPAVEARLTAAHALLTQES